MLTLIDVSNYSEFLVDYFELRIERFILKISILFFIFLPRKYLCNLYQVICKVLLYSAFAIFILNPSLQELQKIDLFLYCKSESFSLVSYIFVCKFSLISQYYFLLQSGVRGLMLDMYDFNNDIWLCHSFGGQCYNYTAFVSVQELVSGNHMRELSIRLICICNFSHLLIDHFKYTSNRPLMFSERSKIFLRQTQQRSSPFSLKTT